MATHSSPLARKLPWAEEPGIGQTGLTYHVKLAFSLLIFYLDDLSML